MAHVLKLSPGNQRNVTSVPHGSTLTVMSMCWTPHGQYQPSVLESADMFSQPFLSLVVCPSSFLFGKK